MIRGWAPVYHTCPHLHIDLATRDWLPSCFPVFLQSTPSIGQRADQTAARGGPAGIGAKDTGGTVSAQPARASAALRGGGRGGDDFVSGCLRTARASSLVSSA